MTKAERTSSVSINSFLDFIDLIGRKIFSLQKKVLSLRQILHQEWLHCPPTGLRLIVGSGGKEMRVRKFNSLKINDYGNQKD